MLLTADAAAVPALLMLFPLVVSPDVAEKINNGRKKKIGKTYGMAVFVKH